MTVKPYERKAHFYETDQMGIIHHANYIHWFEEARVDFMEQIGFGYEKSVESGVDIAVLEVKCTYKAMVRFNDRVHVHLYIKELTPIRMVIGYKITDAADGGLRTTGESMHCFLDTKEHKLLRLDRTLPDLYDLFGTYTETKKA